MAQKTILAKGSVQTVSDLLLKPTPELAKRCRIVWKDMDHLIGLVCNELREEPADLSDVAHLGEDRITTGDPQLDQTLGGGIQTGMLWEICGENNAGKTQLALQLSLAVQLPRERGGVLGSACYVTTREALQTDRLQQMMDLHPVLSREQCGLSDVYTLKAFGFDALCHILTYLFPNFASSRMNAAGLKPAKLLVIDTLTDLFDTSMHPEYEDLKQRARDLRQISLLLHRLASKYQLVIVLLAAARASHPHFDSQDLPPGELNYAEQERWFSRGHSLRGEETHEAILGHAWPNQVNARLMMTRTLRTRFRHEVDPKFRNSPDGRAAKRRRLDSSQPLSTPPHTAGDGRVPYRHLSVIFSSAGPVASCDYVILEQGVLAFAPEEPPPSTFLYAPPAVSQPGGTPWSSPLTPPEASAPTPAIAINLAPDPPVEDDEESLWRLTQDQGDLFDQMGQEVEKEAEAEEGPPADDHGASSDSDYWNE